MRITPLALSLIPHSVLIPTTNNTKIMYDSRSEGSFSSLQEIEHGGPHHKHYSRHEQPFQQGA